jgi:hypothetical protein
MELQLETLVVLLVVESLEIIQQTLFLALLSPLV